MNNQSSKPTDRAVDSLALELFERGQLDDSSLTIDVARTHPDTMFTKATFNKRLTFEGKIVDVVIFGSLEPPILKFLDQDLSPLAFGKIQLDGKWEMISNHHATSIFTGLRQLHHDDSLSEPLNCETPPAPVASEASGSDGDGFTGHVSFLDQLKSEILEIYPEKWRFSAGQGGGATTSVVTNLRVSSPNDDESSVELAKTITAVENEGTRSWGEPEYSLSVRNSRGADQLAGELGSDDLRQLFCHILASMKGRRTS